jgi:hypothetical protein
MQLGDLVKPIEDMTDEELRERLHGIRHRQTVERPATQARAAKKQKKEVKKKLSPLSKMLDQLSPEELEQLLKDMGQ